MQMYVHVHETSNATVRHRKIAHEYGPCLLSLYTYTRKGIRIANGAAGITAGVSCIWTLILFPKLSLPLSKNFQKVNLIPPGMPFSSKASSLLTTVNTHLGSYEIQELPREPLRLECHPSLFKYSNIFAWCLWFYYIIYQLYFASVLQDASPNFMWRMWLVLLAEFLLSFQEVVWGLSGVFALICAKDAWLRPCYRLVGNSAPTVDVFITCCREPNDVIIDTVAAAVAQDYPSQRFRVFILDDGHDEKLQEAMKRLSTRSAETNGPKVWYLSRKLEAGFRSYFKAGNLQFGIEESMRWGGSEYIASLDSDMIPEPDWLRRMIPHLLLDNQMALACPPQVFKIVRRTAGGGDAN